MTTQSSPAPPTNVSLPAFDLAIPDGVFVSLFPHLFRPRARFERCTATTHTQQSRHQDLVVTLDTICHYHQLDLVQLDSPGSQLDSPGNLSCCCSLAMKKAIRQQPQVFTLNLMCMMLFLAWLGPCASACTGLSLLINGTTSRHAPNQRTASEAHTTWTLSSCLPRLGVKQHQFHMVSHTSSWFHKSRGRGLVHRTIVLQANHLNGLLACLNKGTVTVTTFNSK